MTVPGGIGLAAVALPLLVPAVAGSLIGADAFWARAGRGLPAKMLNNANAANTAETILINRITRITCPSLPVPLSDYGIGNTHDARSPILKPGCLRRSKPNL